MTGQDLKNSILQLAIQGKLVPQNPDDEPASVLLERIKAEKKKLIEEKKIKKEKTLPEITEDEKPFEIPESWEWCRLGEIVSFVGGYAYKSHDFIEDSSYQVLRLGNVKNDYLKLNASPVFIPEDIALITEKYKCLPYDILITMTGTRKKRDYFFTYKVSENDCNLFINQRVGALRPYESLVSDYLRFSLKSETILQDVFQYETGTANQGNLGAENILKILFPLPPLSEQHRIVAKIEELMPLVDEYDKAQKELDSLNSAMPEQLKQSLLQEAIMGKLGTNNPDDEPASVLLQRIKEEKAQLIKDKKIKKEKPLPEITEDEIPFEIPENWVWVKLNDVFNIVSARRVHQKDWKTSGIPFYRTREIGWLSENRNADTELFIDESLYAELTKTGCPSENDIMMTAVGTIGKTYIVRKDDKFYYKDASVLCLENFSKVNPKYFCYLFNSDYFKNMASNGAMGTTVATITIVRANSYIVPLPPLAEQHRIVEKLENLFACIEPLAKDVK